MRCLTTGAAKCWRDTDTTRSRTRLRGSDRGTENQRLPYPYKGAMVAAQGVSCGCTGILGPWRVSSRIIWTRITAPLLALLWRIGRRLGSVLQASITINLFSGEYTASSRLISSRVTRSQAAEPQTGTDRGTGTRIRRRLDVRFGPNYVRFTPNSRHSRASAGLPLMTHSGLCPG